MTNPGDEDVLAWQLATDVPDHWIPLVPVRAGTPDGAIRFRRGAALSRDGSNVPRHARSRILNPTPGARLDVFEEEVPREGVRIVRAFQFARWLDGQPLLWVGRRKSIGRGEGIERLAVRSRGQADVTRGGCPRVTRGLRSRRATAR